MTNSQLVWTSEERSRLPGRGDRLLLVLAYAFVFLALCLLLADFCRLLLRPDQGQDLFATQQVSRQDAGSRRQ